MWRCTEEMLFLSVLFIGFTLYYLLRKRKFSLSEIGFWKTATWFLKQVKTPSVILDKEGRLIQLNEHAMQFFNVSEKDVGTDVRARLPGLQHFAIVTDCECCEVSLIHPETNHKLTFCFDVFPIQIAQSLRSSTYYCILYRDVTEQTNLQLQLMQAERLATIGQLAAGLAHEIRNPITSIRGFIQLSEADQPLNPFYREIILDELHRINHLVSEVLLLAKPSVLTKEPTSITELLQETYALMSPLATIHDVELFLHIQEPVPEVHVDPAQLKQVLINLIKNAVEAVPNKGQVIIECVAQESFIQVSIVDNGPGIPLEAQKKLFTPFYSTKNTGTGLGLTVCRRIVENHGGIIMVDSKPGYTCFTVKIPVL